MVVFRRWLIFGSASAILTVPVGGPLRMLERGQWGGPPLLLRCHDFAELDKQLAARGWRYDPECECFMDGKRRVSYLKVLALVPGTEDELASYQEEKHDSRPNPVTP